MILLAVAFCAQSPKVVQKEIQSRYCEWSKAYMAVDVDALLGILSPDYVLVNLEREETSLAQYSTYLKLKKKSGYKDPVKTSTKIHSLVLKPDEADVDAVETMISSGLDPNSGKVAWCLHKHEYMDIWRRMDRVWRLARTTTLRESTDYKAK